MNSRVEGHRRQGVDVELVPHGIAVPHQGLDVEQGLLLASGSLLEGDDRELVIQLSGHDAMDVGKLLNLKICIVFTKLDSNKWFRLTGPLEMAVKYGVNSVHWNCFLNMLKKAGTSLER